MVCTLLVLKPSPAGLSLKLRNTVAKRRARTIWFDSIEKGRKKSMGGGCSSRCLLFPFCSSFLHLDHIVSDGWRLRVPLCTAPVCKSKSNPSPLASRWSGGLICLTSHLLSAKDCQLLKKIACLLVQLTWLGWSPQMRLIFCKLQLE